jgi:hypothetical protein
MSTPKIAGGCREMLADLGAILEGVTSGYVGALCFHGPPCARRALPDG